MRKWLNELNFELDKYLYEDEKQEAIRFYEEIVNDRVDRGERLDDVLRDYDPKRIARDFTSGAIVKRDFTNRKVASKSAWQMLLIFFSTPILIPLGIVYLAVLLVFFVVMVALLVTMASLIIYLVAYIPAVFMQPDPLAVKIGMTGVGLIAISLTSIILLILYKVFWVLVKIMVQVFTKPLTRKKA